MCPPPAGGDEQEQVGRWCHCQEAGLQRCFHAGSREVWGEMEAQKTQPRMEGRRALGVREQSGMFSQLNWP